MYTDKPLVHEALGGYSYTVQLFLLNINVLCRRTSMYNRSTTEVQVPSASCTRGFKVLPDVAVAVRSCVIDALCLYMYMTTANGNRYVREYLY